MLYTQRLKVKDLAPKFLTFSHFRNESTTKMKLTFCGAARQVTGSSHLITLDNGYKILLDCGLYQGHDDEMENFNETWIYDPKEVDCLIVSHAHIDHTGRVPKLVKDGFAGDIFCTHATRSLCSIMLMDSAKIQERDAQYHNKKKFGKKKKKPLYSTHHVKKTLELVTGLSYNRWHHISDEVKIQFRDAGHLLGSANVTLMIEEPGKEPVLIGFTGDIGRPMRPILSDPIPMPEVDYMICESTYGNREHESHPDELEHFLNVIKETCVENKGKLLIPAFSIGRTQEIVYMLDRLETAGRLPKIPVYVDSPLAVNATTIYGSHPECYDENINEYLLVDDNPFGFNHLKYVRDRGLSKKINQTNESCIVISASGMMNAGRIKHHLFNSMEDPKNGLLLVGYCAPHTPGGRLKNGAKELRLFGQTRKVNMKVHQMHSFSAHADRVEMAGFLKNQTKLKQLFLVHGEYDTQQEFKTYLGQFGHKHVEIPELGQEFVIA